MTIALLTLGCKLNFAETATYERGFLAAGLEVVPWSERADVYLINTCSVTATADSKSRNLVRKVHRINPDARIIVTGCSAELRRAEIERIEGVSRVFGAVEKGLVVQETLAMLGLPASGPAAQLSEASGMPDRESDHPAIPLEGAQGVKATNTQQTFAAYSSAESRTRAFLKVQDGCNNFCKYCTVPYARGRSRNIPVAECVRNARKIAAEGVKEIVLTGVNTGDFGRTTGESFLDLLKALDEVDGIERYRISSIEPNLLTEEIVDWIASGTKFQPHFHIPLQTGSDTLLAAMGRHYDTAFFAERLEMVRRKMERPGGPKVFFGIDVMVGLPGETDALFKETFRFIDRVHPAFIHVFPYSRRPGTPAAAMPGQVDETVKKHRVAVLEELCARLHAEFREANRGVRERVLFESTDRGGMMEGYTGNYIRIARPYDPTLVGTLTDIVIE
ncbi:MAG: tRNA (N(6)-L-threonylcarbamoyladenosine(37)-C(2))-methylthiotransferase MtaB [Bacteroidales bacterium]|nr:tRNA (N(6)-L-threonylcarbamoyladenosine(37)-C(2))-methylthiotransferase MtaB [Bacteroidales bacterium]